MSRKTKHKSEKYGILDTGAVVRLDTLKTWSEEKRASARGFAHAKAVWDEPDLDYTRAHREALSNPPAEPVG
jgi:hypothetical protein